MDIPPDLISLFDLSSDGFPWRAPRPHQIENRRAQLSDLLIFDILLSSGGVRQPDTLWPPTDPESLRRLLDAIEDSAYDALKKDCLIYFLLKWHQDGREERFREDKCIPPQFAMLSDAYWHLDSGIHVERAVSLLCDVRLNRDYTSKIIQAISLSDNSTRLLLQYLRTAKPMLTEPDDMDTYILALAEDGLACAWQYQRTFPDKSEIRTRLTRKVLEWCFTPKPRPEHLKQLITFPLSAFEQSLLHKFALEPPASLPAYSVSVLQDLVCVRLVQSGQYVEAIKLDQQFASTRLGRGTQASQAAERRRKMIEDVIAALPSIERQETEEKLRAVAPRKPQTKATPVDLNMSWEEIPPPPRALPVKSGAPRFILGRPTYGHNQPKVVPGPMIEAPPTQPVGSLLAPAHTRGIGGVVPPGLNGATHVHSAPTLLLPSSRAGPGVGLVGPGPQTSKPFLNSSGSGGHRPSPLFPSHASREMRHPIANQTVLYSQKPIPSEEFRADASSLQKDVEAQRSTEARLDGEDRHDDHPRAPEPIPVTEFSESVFSGSRPGPSPYPRETTEPLLPGAFRPEREIDQLEQNAFAHSPPTPPHGCDRQNHEGRHGHRFQGALMRAQVERKTTFHRSRKFPLPSGRHVDGCHEQIRPMQRKTTRL
ncbi:nuclear pore complex assembly-domain-containing protein [Russula vinacea]|nr:nuclear pore complex assembly-domain-containing protein [Russula vinacea]